MQAPHSQGFVLLNPDTTYRIWSVACWLFLCGLWSRHTAWSVDRSPCAPGPGPVHSHPQVTTGEYTTEGALESRSIRAVTESLVFKAKVGSTKTVLTLVKAGPSKVLEKTVK